MELTLALAPIHLPPEGMVMNDFWQPVMTFGQVLPVIVVVWLTGRRWLPGEPVLAAACLVGGGLASFIEPMVDHLGLVWFAPEGMWEMFRTFGRPMPWFILPCYVWYIGGQAILTLYLLRRGLSRRGLFTLYGAYMLSNVVMEIPAIAAGIYAYYGPQPFEVAGLPIWFQFINAASPIVAAAVIHRIGARRGWHPLMAVAVVPCSHVLTNAVAAWPTWSALNSTSSLAVVYATAVVTIGLAVLLVHLVSLTVTTAASPADAGANRPEERRPVAAAGSRR
jgi:hypothetical protein